METYKVIIVGSGPAGMFAARELEAAGINALLLERGKKVSHRKCPMTIECYECTSCHEIEGVGGAGGFSDGKLCNGSVGISKDIIGENYHEEVSYVNQIFKAVLGENYQPSSDKGYFYIYELFFCRNIVCF